MSRPLIISDCDDVLLYMVAPFRDWLDEQHGVVFDMGGGDFGRAMKHRDGDLPVEEKEIWRLLNLFFDGEMHRQMPVPGVVEKTASFGLMAAKALEERKLDGFWANGMGAEVAVRKGIGTVVLDARRDGPEEAKGYTFPALVCTEKMIKEKPDAARAALRAVKAAQDALRTNPERATEVGKRLFPPTEAGLIAELIRRDAPFYDPAISPQSVESMNRFAAGMGLLSKKVAYEDVVWKG